MNFEPFVVQQPSAYVPTKATARWTLVDMILVVVVTLLLAVAVVLLTQVLRVFGFSVREALTDYPLVASMIGGGLLYSLFVLSTQLVIVRRKRASWNEIGFRTPPLLPMLLTPLIFGVQMSLLVITNLVLFAILGEFTNPQQQALTDPRGFSWLNFAVVFLVGAIIAPIVEELLFRGLLYQWLRARTNVAVAVIGSAAMFSAAHVIPILLPALFIVGLILALAFEYSRSLWVTITLHFLQNALAISVLFFVQANPQLFPQT